MGRRGGVDRSVGGGGGGVDGGGWCVLISCARFDSDGLFALQGHCWYPDGIDVHTSSGCEKLTRDAELGVGPNISGSDAVCRCPRGEFRIVGPPLRDVMYSVPASCCWAER